MDREQQLAALVIELDELKAKKAEVVHDYNEAIKNLSAEIRKLAEEIESGQEVLPFNDGGEG